MQATRELRRWFSVRPRPPRTGLVYLVVRFLVYAIALLLILLVYGTKARGLISGPPIAVLTGAAEWYLLGDTAVDARRRLLLAGGIGVLLAELTWAVGYWSGPPMAGALVLMLAFYVLSGVVEHGVGRALDRGVVLEYTVVALIGTLFVVSWFRLWSA